MTSHGQISHRGRMPGRASQSWCPSCGCQAGPDCPDIAKTPRQVRRQLHRELEREIQEVLACRTSRSRGEPAG